MKLTAEKLSDKYYLLPAVAWLRGLPYQNYQNSENSATDIPLHSLTEDTLIAFIKEGEAKENDLNLFQKYPLPAHLMQIGTYLKGLNPDNMLYVGAGRGLFLWKLLELFPQLPITVTEQNPRKVKVLQQVREGGMQQLKVVEGGLQTLAQGQRAPFDVVICPENLAFAQEPLGAVKQMTALANRFLLIATPFFRDAHPLKAEFINREDLQMVWQSMRCSQVKFEQAGNYLLSIARK